MLQKQLILIIQNETTINPFDEKKFSQDKIVPHWWVVKMLQNMVFLKE